MAGAPAETQLAPSVFLHVSSSFPKTYERPQAGKVSVRR